MPKGKEKAKLVFENEQYSISTVPLNWVIRFKILVDGRKPGSRQKLLATPYYCGLDRPIDYVHDMAKYTINKYL